MADMFQNLRDTFSRMTTGQRLRLAAAVVTTVALVWGISLYATRVRYAVLFSNLEAEDAASVVSYLKKQQVPYRVEAGGAVIEVPVHRVDELRMELAGEGLPRGGGVGFEIFDKPSFGLSDFVQNVNYRRALERELSRSIQSLDGVASARVHLALPPESVFADERREASASVVVGLARAGSLPSHQVRAITHLVASGVEGLDPSKVSVVDSHGKMLSDGSGDEDTGVLSAAQMEAKEAMERKIERTLIAILEPIVGPGRVRARASVELNTKRVHRVEEVFDPDGAVVRSEQKTRTRTPGAAGGGVPGTASNLPGGGGGAVASAAGGQESQQSVTNFEINKTVSTVSEPMGTLLRQSVAVVVDNAQVPVEGEGGEGGVTSQPRSEEEMRKLTDLVRAAAGIQEERGDVLIVENVPFEATPPGVEALEETGTDWVHLSLTLARYAALPLAVLLLALLVIRPAVQTLRQFRPAATGAPAGAPTVAQLQEQLARGGLLPAGGGQDLRSKLIEAAREDPKAAALVIRGWLGAEEAEG